MNLPARFHRPVAWTRARFTPGTHLGLHLTAGALAAAVALWAFGALAEDVVHQEPIVAIDLRVAHWFHERATPGSTRLMFSLSTLGSGEWVAGAALLFAGYLAGRRAWHWLVLLVLVTPGGALLTLGLKTAFGRARPVFDDPIQMLNSYSFPSGHTMAATLFYGLLALHGAVHLPGWRGRAGAILCALLLSGLVGLSRVALGVHYLSDVLGAFAASVAWLALCFTAVETRRRRPVAGAPGPSVSPP